MSIFLVYAFIFFCGSLIGWIIELIFRTFFAKENKSHKLINPGFLNGPYLPIYGFGLCCMYLMSGLDDFSFINNYILRRLVLFVLMAISMTIIEYIAGFIFTRFMKVKLWDYSNEWGNINGIVCPKFSFFWAILSAVYYFFVHPRVLNGIAWLSNNLAFSFFVGFFYGVFIIDVCISFNLAVRLTKFAAENDIVVKYERLKTEIKESLEERNRKAKFLFSFRADKPINEFLKIHLKNIREHK